MGRARRAAELGQGLGSGRDRTAWGPPFCKGTGRAQQPRAQGAEPRSRVALLRCPTPLLPATACGGHAGWAQGARGRKPPARHHLNTSQNARSAGRHQGAGRGLAATSQSRPASKSSVRAGGSSHAPPRAGRPEPVTPPPRWHRATGGSAREQDELAAPAQLPAAPGDGGAGRGPCSTAVTGDGPTPAQTETGRVPPPGCQGSSCQHSPVRALGRDRKEQGARGQLPGSDTSSHHPPRLARPRATRQRGLCPRRRGGSRAGLTCTRQ